MTKVTSKFAYAVLTAIALSIVTPGTASAEYYDCDHLHKQLLSADWAFDPAKQLLRDVKAQVRAGKFGRGELKGARQNYRARKARFQKAQTAYQAKRCG